MPFVTINLLAGRTEAQKEAAASGIARIIAETMGVEPSKTQIIFVDVPSNSWSHGGKLVSQRSAGHDGAGGTGQDT